MSTEYTLTNYDARGLAEPARFLLAYGGANWKDIRIPAVAGAKTPIPDDIKARLTYGQFPLLEFDGKRLVQSKAIFRYLAKQFNLNGKDDFEAAQCDEIVDAVKDTLDLFMAPFKETDETKRAEALQKAKESAVSRYFSKFIESVESNGGYLVGNNLTWADIYLTCFLENLDSHVECINVAEDFPALAKLMETVRNAPGIKEYLAQRPVTAW